MLLKAFVCVVTLTLEIPSGYFADMFGRKLSMLVGQAFLLLAMVLYYLGTDLSDFFVAEFFVGVGWSFISGADSALAFDSVTALGQSHKYLRLESRLLAISAFGEAIGGLLGGLLAAKNLHYTFLIQGVLYLLSLISIMLVVEPPKNIKIDTTKKLAEFKRALKYISFDNIQIRWLLIFNAIEGSATFLIVWLSQAYMQELKFPVIYFGTVWFALHIWLSLVNYFAEGFYNFFGERVCFLIITALVPISYFAMSAISLPWGIAFVFVLYFVRGIRAPLSRSEIHKRVASDIRATVISTVSFATSLAFIIISPGLGWISDIYSLKTAFLSAGLLYLLIGFWSVRHLLSSLDLKKKS